MNKKAHSNPKSLSWIISLVIVIILSGAVIFGSKLLYDNSQHLITTISSSDAQEEAPADTASSASPVPTA